MWGIIAITQNGLQLACKLNEVFPESVVYTLPKWEKSGLKLIEGDLQSFVATLFERHRVLVFVMATGIVVRSIAPHLKSKTSDPAVLVMDEKGKFVISLLSGHLGGANAVAQQIALKTGAEAVITTSSDVNGLMAVDMFAKDNGLIIDTMADAKNITAMLVNGQCIGQCNETRWQVPEVYSPEIENVDGIVLISNKSSVSSSKPLVKLIPRNITLGVGCRRGTSASSIIAFINSELEKNNIDERSLCRIASIDVKKDEEGLVQAAQHFGLELVFFTASELAKVEEYFSLSDFVKQQVGVGAVCEPAAYLACNGNGEFILRKQSHEGITLAIFEEASPLLAKEGQGEVSFKEHAISKLHSRKELKELRQNLRNNSTPAEIRLWKYLQGEQLEGRKFRRQHSVGNYIVYFYCPQEKMAVELVGGVHFNPVNEQYDLQRKEYIESQGIRVLTFENEDVFQKLEIVLQTIKQHFKD